MVKFFYKWIEKQAKPFDAELAIQTCRAPLRPGIVTHAGLYCEGSDFAGEINWLFQFNENTVIAWVQRWPMDYLSVRDQTDDEAWNTAARLNEMSFVLIDDGRCLACRTAKEKAM